MCFMSSCDISFYLGALLCLCKRDCRVGCAVTLPFSYHLLTVENRVWFKGSPCEICDTNTNYFSTYFSFPLLIMILLVPHIHSCIIHGQYCVPRYQGTWTHPTLRIKEKVGILCYNHLNLLFCGWEC